MGDDLKEIDFTDARIAEVRAAVKAVMQQDGLSNAAVARDAGVGESTLASFLTGSYKGRNEAQALLLQRWMTARLAHAAVKMQAPRGPDFVRTRSAAAFAELLEHAQYTPDFSVIVGVPGIGKTVTARQYKQNGHNVWMITAHPTGGSAKQIVSAVADVLGITNLNVYGLNSIILRRLMGLHALLIVDEAQHLTSQALDQLRTYHDIAGCGVVLLGNHSIFRHLEGGQRSADYAQLFSRVGMRLDRKKPHSDDIEAMLDAWQIDDKGVRRVARAVARRPGALRAMNKVLRQAHLRAGGEDRPVGEADMLAAARQLGDEMPLDLGDRA